MVTQKNKALKREEALNRDKIYLGLSLEERLKLISSRRGKSKKETNKILKQMKEIKNNEKNNY